MFSIYQAKNQILVSLITFFLCAVFKSEMKIMCMNVKRE
ncbi:hypothetical protein KKH3_33020 [Pectobacterium actinidiae]|nr:hypothetical protein KKH3_33020 [Pectobacterium actinidiae]